MNLTPLIYAALRHFVIHKLDDHKMLTEIPCHLT